MSASAAEKHVFGANTKLHPVTAMPIETGIGAASEHDQALGHIARVAETQGQEAGEKLTQRLAEHEKPPAPPQPERRLIGKSEARGLARKHH